MIPTEDQCKQLWDKYHLPETKRLHVSLVAKVALFFAQKFQVDISLLRAAALLHDIDKAVPRLPGEIHPDTAVRVLQEEGMGEVAAMVKTHSLHAIVDPAISPKSWEEKLLYLADKMVKYDIITVDERFALWRNEQLSADAKAVLDKSYPLVKKLEKEVMGLLGLNPEDVAKFA